MKVSYKNEQEINNISLDDAKLLREILILEREFNSNAIQDEIVGKI